MLGNAGQRPLGSFELLQGIIVLSTQSIGLSGKKVIAPLCAILKGFKQTVLSRNILSKRRKGIQTRVQAIDAIHAV